jgi:hypothetical protein
MWMALDIFIGLTLCYALISLFCSVIQEFIAQALDSRGKLLVEALKGVNLHEVIQKAETGVVKNPGWLLRLPWVTRWGGTAVAAPAVPSPDWREKLNNMVDKNTGGPRLPHDISPANLALALIEGSGLITSGVVTSNFDATVQGMNLPKALKSRLLALSADARENVDRVKKEIETWFTDFMAQVQHWYIRRAQAASMIIGLLVALSLNVDTIEIAKTLYHQPAKREAVVKLAAKIDASGESALCAEAKVANLKAGKENVANCLSAIETVYPFTLGWDQVNPEKYKTASEKGAFAIMGYIKDRLLEDFKLLGILLTGLALSLGARFWFDLLKKLVAIRTGGQPDAKAA